ncbi:hypothetical protein FACS1894198_3020 [Clostridia bacterium]|nr:hypothetical protein FACS1894198_3020 [Clostridia bacterium]
MGMGRKHFKYGKKEDLRTLWEKEREELFCDLFVRKEKRDRWKSFLADGRRRIGILDEFNHKALNVLDTRKIYCDFDLKGMNTRRISELEELVLELSSGKANDKNVACYMFGEEISSVQGGYEISVAKSSMFVVDLEIREIRTALRLFCDGTLFFGAAMMIGNNVGLVKGEFYFDHPLYVLLDDIAMCSQKRQGDTMKGDFWNE